jgi:hypothetical protein
MLLNRKKRSKRTQEGLKADARKHKQGDEVGPRLDMSKVCQSVDFSPDGILMRSATDQVRLRSLFYKTCPFYFSISLPSPKKDETAVTAWKSLFLKGSYNQLPNLLYVLCRSFIAAFVYIFIF